MTRAALRERLVAGDFDDVRVVVESLAEEFDVARRRGGGGEDGARGARTAMRTRRRRTRPAASAGAPPAATDNAVEATSDNTDKRTPQRERHGKNRPPLKVTRLFIGAGRAAGIRPADLVGAIAGETGIPASAIGAIEIADSHSLVEVPDELADEIVARMKHASLRGQKRPIRRDR